MSRVDVWEAPGRLRVWRVEWTEEGFTWRDPAAADEPRPSYEPASVLSLAHEFAMSVTKARMRRDATTYLFVLLNALVDAADEVERRYSRGRDVADPGALQVAESLRLAYWRCWYELATRSRGLTCSACGADPSSGCRNRVDGSPIATTHEERVIALARAVGYLSDAGEREQ